MSAHQFHGSVFDYVRNEAFDARNWFNRPPEPQPPLRQHTFGGTLGGPVVRDGTFFFFSYEGLLLRQPRLDTRFLYTREARAAVAAVYRPIVDALPVPNGPLQDPACDNVARPCRASLTMSYTDPTDVDAFSLRVDHTLNRSVSLFMRVGHTPSVTGTRGLASVASEHLNTNMATLGATASLSPTVVNDLRVNWSRSHGGVEIRTIDAFGATPPAVSPLLSAGPFRMNGAAFILPDGTVWSTGTRVVNTSRQFTVVDTVSWSRGTHQLKLGVDYRHLQPASERGTAYVVQLSDFNQLTAGTMMAVAVEASEPIAVRMHNGAAFAQDNWTVGERVTLTYGVRWEMNTPPVSITPDKPLFAIRGVFDAEPLQLAPAGTPLWRTRYNTVLPRAGTAYQLTPTTTLRGGIGQFADLGYGRLLGNFVRSFPYNRTRTTIVSGQTFDLTNPAFVPPSFSTSLSTFTQGNLEAFDPNLQLPLTMEWNASAQREFAANQSLSVTYVGAAGRRLLRPDLVVPPQLRQANGPPVSVTRNAGESRYDALQVQFQQRSTRGFQALASYTLAKASDTESDDSGGNFTGVVLNGNYGVTLDDIDVPPLAPADFDIRHAFSAAVSYEIPALALGKAARALFDGWGVDAIVRVSSAPPVNVRIRGQSTELGLYATQPDLVPGQPLWLAAPDQPGGRILNPDAFTLPAPGARGNFPRNSIRNPFGIAQTDLALRRRFPLTGGTSLEFRAEFFNLFNHPMFGGLNGFWGRCTATPCTGQQNANFGTVAGTLNEALGGGGLNGGQSAVYAIGGPRSIQFSLKLRF